MKHPDLDVAHRPAASMFRSQKTMADKSEKHFGIRLKQKLCVKSQGLIRGERTLMTGSRSFFISAKNSSDLQMWRLTP